MMIGGGQKSEGGKTAYSMPRPVECSCVPICCTLSLHVVQIYVGGIPCPVQKEQNARQYFM